jgi:hypothetical protein
MKLSALGEDGIILMATSSQIERHRRRRLETLGAFGETAVKLCILGEDTHETMRLRRRRVINARHIGDDFTILLYIYCAYLLCVSV